MNTSSHSLEQFQRRKAELLIQKKECEARLMRHYQESFESPTPATGLQKWAGNIQALLNAYDGFMMAMKVVKIFRRFSIKK